MPHKNALNHQKPANHCKVNHGNARLVQISVNPQGGVPKRGVLQARLLFNNVEGDKQRNLKFHGGPERAVCLFSYEVIQELQKEGHPIDCGTTGENLTISGLDWSALAPGVRLQIGDEALIEITRPTTPCKTIAASFTDGDFTRISHKKFPNATRYYARILREGTIYAHDFVQIKAC